MKYLKSILVVIFTIMMPACQSSSPTDISFIEGYISSKNDERDEVRIQINDLGIPLYDRYSSLQTALAPHDMIVYEENLYIGCGDFTANSGPVDLWRYSILNKAWELSGTVPDEAVYKFKIIDGILATPGIDPRESWDWGNFYFLENDAWNIKRTMPQGVHCFDLEYWDGKIFAATQVSDGNHYVAVSEDGGDTFANIPLKKNGKIVNAGIRYYDIFIIDSRVYAYCNMELYEYKETSFDYVESLFYAIQGQSLGSYTMEGPIKAEVNCNGQIYMATGNLYACTTIEDLRYIKSRENEKICDLYLYNESIYGLAIRKDDDEYTNIVYEINDDTLETVLGFSYRVPAMSFAVYENKFYFGMMSYDLEEDNENNGRVLEIELLG